jgi:hypothetical protein
LLIDAILAAVRKINRIVRQISERKPLSAMEGKSAGELGNGTSTAQFPRLRKLRQDHFENPFVMFVQ